MRFETRALHAGHAIDPTGAVAPPIHLSTTFARDEALVPVGGYTYIRESNPTQSLLEAALGPLEGGEGALVFASGMAAAVAMLQSLKPGDHVVLPNDAYYGVRSAGQEFFRGWGITVDLAAMNDLAALRAALTPATKLVWLETPSNPLMSITDLHGAIAVAREAGALTVVDNTFATPALQRPLELGADVVLHSATKYLGGHGDVQGGALVFRKKDELFTALQHIRHVLGAVASPFNSWLVLRGIKTLSCRMALHSANALVVAQRLSGHPKVAVVHYPGLVSDPGHGFAKAQMSAFGGMLSFRVRAGGEAAKRVVGNARLFTRATSLGGVESLIEHRATSEGPDSSTPQELVRLSVGLEHPEDLWADLDQALARS